MSETLQEKVHELALAVNEVAGSANLAGEAAAKVAAMQALIIRIRQAFTWSTVQTESLVAELEEAMKALPEIRAGIAPSVAEFPDAPPIGQRPLLNPEMWDFPMPGGFRPGWPPNSNEGP